jgi:hypothetical protein
MIGYRMSTSTDHTDELFKSANDLAEGVNKGILRLRADRLDGILNGEIMPYLGLDASDEIAEGFYLPISKQRTRLVF